MEHQSDGTRKKITSWTSYWINPYWSWNNLHCCWNHNDNLVEKAILAEYIDLLQGRIPKSVFARHYLKVEDGRELASKVLAVTSKMEDSLLVDL